MVYNVSKLWNVCTSQSLVQIKLKTAFHGRGASNAVLDVCAVCTVPNEQVCVCVRVCSCVRMCAVCCWFSALHGCLLDIIVDFVFRIFLGFGWLYRRRYWQSSVLQSFYAYGVQLLVPRAAYTFYTTACCIRLPLRRCRGRNTIFHPVLLDWIHTHTPLAWQARQLQMQNPNKNNSGSGSGSDSSSTRKRRRKIFRITLWQNNNISTRTNLASMSSCVSIALCILRLHTVYKRVVQCVRFSIRRNKVGYSMKEKWMLLNRGHAHTQSQRNCDTSDSVYMGCMNIEHWTMYT